MIRNTRKEWLIALALIAPFLAIYGLVFIYPTIDMVRLSFTDAPLIGPGEFVGTDNYTRLTGARRFGAAFGGALTWVGGSVLPGTVVALLVALAVSRLSGRVQSIVLALFFLPYILPVSVIYLIWDWTLNFQFGIAMHLFDALGMDRIPVFKSSTWFIPAVALITVWWTCGFNVLLFLAGLRAIPQEVYEAAALDNAGRWRTFSKVTWPLLWPITALNFTIQLILQMKIFDQVYLFSQGGRPNDNLVMVYYIFQRAFVNNHGGRAAAVAVVLFGIVIVVSVLNFQLMRFAERKQ